MPKEHALKKTGGSTLSSAKDKSIFVAIGFFALVLLLTTVIRALETDGLFLGDDSYYNLRIAETIREKGWINQDELSYSSRPLINEKGFPLLLSLAPTVLARTLPFIFGLVSLFFFYRIIEHFKPHLALAASMIVAVNPTTIYLFTAATKYAVAVFIVLLATYSYLNGKIKHAFYTLLPLPLFSIASSIMIVFLSFFLLKKHKIKKNYFTILILVYLALFLVLYPFLFKLGFPEAASFSVKEFGLKFLQHEFIAEFGGNFGIGAFTLILALFGIYFRWQDKYKYLLIFLPLPLFILLIIYFPFLLYYLTFILSGFAAYTLFWFWNKEWRNVLFRNFVFILLICGLLFSPIAYIKEIHTIEPTKNIGNALKFLKEQSGEDVVLSSYQNGILINSARKQNIMDAHFLYAPQINQRWNDINTVFNTQNLEETRQILNKYDVTYVYVDKTMREELWSTDESGLLFLLKYGSKVFGKIYSNEEVDIYFVY